MNAGPKSSVRLDGILVIDKPKGPTSHDVVGRLRRSLGMRQIGHAGTLDPAATGILVVALGEATKLCAYLTAHEKRYQATIAFGRATNTLDADGDTTATSAVPLALRHEIGSLAAGLSTDGPLERALASERVRREQEPPAFSAIKLGGRTAHESARRGEPLALAPRPVQVFELSVMGGTEEFLTLSLTVSKGYYVRSLARDLGKTMGIPAHLAALVRIASGPFRLEEAIAPTAAPEALVAAVLPLGRAAARAMPCARLTPLGVTLARQGKRLSAEHFDGTPPIESSAWLDPQGEVIAVGAFDEQRQFFVRRGFTYPISSEVT